MYSCYYDEETKDLIIYKNDRVLIIINNVKKEQVDRALEEVIG